MENVCHIIRAPNTIEISFVQLHLFRYLIFHLCYENWKVKAT